MRTWWQKKIFRRGLHDNDSQLNPVRVLLRDGFGRFTIRHQRKYSLPSTQKMMKAMRYLGAQSARLQIPLLHPDHIKYAAIVLRDLAEDFNAIATERGSNMDKIFYSRVAVLNANRDLAHYARKDMQHIRADTDQE
tara:strand:+ start:512 stop:919 length:408 start_codon:yes stop_codon:yes gene_type:complete